MAIDGYVTDVSYIPGFYTNLAPVAIRYAAAVNRVVGPATGTEFRYLELGCGLGRALTTLAAANPQGRFVGVDVNPDHIAAAARDVTAGGLENVRLVTADFADLPDDLGDFDFIALHGVLSWVGPAVRNEILATARDRLVPGGLLVVSYNSLPGWAHLQPIRGILQQYAALRKGDSSQRLRDALAYLVYIRDKKAKYFEDNPRASQYVDALLKQDARYLVHEYLNEHWTAFYFTEVAAMFASAGLTFAGSLPVHTNFWDLCVRPEFHELFRTTGNRLVTEAHKDFCANTAFRWDIYARQPRLISDLQDRLRSGDDLHYRLARPDASLPHQVNLGVVTSTVQGPLFEALVELLAGGSRPLSAILADGRLAAAPPDDVARAIDAGVAMGLFEVSAHAIPAPPDVAAFSDRSGVRIPLAFNRAMLAAESLGGRPLALASRLTGTGHALGDLDAAILDELAARGAEGLADRVESRLTASGRTIQRDGAPVSDRATRTEMLAGACDLFRRQSLPMLTALGIVAHA